MAPVLKTGIPERVSGVRIPPSPPCLIFLGFSRNFRCVPSAYFTDHHRVLLQYSRPIFGSSAELAAISNLFGCLLQKVVNMLVRLGL
jgi:hypothetical protein